MSYNPLIKHVMYPITLSVHLALQWSFPHRCFESVAILALESYPPICWTAQSKIYESWGCVADPIACNMLNSCNICYLNKRLVRVGPVGGLITKMKHSVSPRAQAP